MHNNSIKRNCCIILFDHFDSMIHVFSCTPSPIYYWRNSISSCKSIRKHRYCFAFYRCFSLYSYISNSSTRGTQCVARSLFYVQNCACMPHDVRLSKIRSSLWCCAPSFSATITVEHVCRITTTMHNKVTKYRFTLLKETIYVHNARLTWKLHFVMKTTTQWKTNGNEQQIFWTHFWF